MDFETEVGIPSFEPWTKYPSLTQDRLAIVADVIRRVRHDAILLHEPDKGDTNWGLGCRVYERTCSGLRTESRKHTSWLVVLPETRNLQFSFAIGSVPFRFYRGTPDNPPDRYAISSFGELHHLQMCLELEGLRPLDNVLRLAVETSPMTLEVITVSVVEVDTARNPIATYQIPLRHRAAQPVTLLQAKPVELAPPQVEPLATIEEIGRVERPDGEQAKIAKTNSGS